MKSTSRLALCVVACALVGCPVGCRKGNPQTLHVGPPEEIHVEKTGPCTFRATPPLRHEWGPTHEGVWFKFIDDEVWPPYCIDYDPATAMFTVAKKCCPEGVQSLRITFRPWIRTENE